MARQQLSPHWVPPTDQDLTLDTSQHSKKYKYSILVQNNFSLLCTILSSTFHQHPSYFRLELCWKRSLMEHMKWSRRGRMVAACWSQSTPGSGLTPTLTWSTWQLLQITVNTTSRREVWEPRAENVIRWVEDAQKLKLKNIYFLVCRLRRALMDVICCVVTEATPPDERGEQRDASASSTGAATWSVKSVWEMFKYPPATDQEDECNQTSREDNASQLMNTSFSHTNCFMAFILENIIHHWLQSM